LSSRAEFGCSTDGGGDGGWERTGGRKRRTEWRRRKRAFKETVGFQRPP